MSSDDEKSNDCETNSSLIGKILTKMKSEFNKKPVSVTDMPTQHNSKSSEESPNSDNEPPKLIAESNVKQDNENEEGPSSPPKIDIGSPKRKSESESEETASKKKKKGETVLKNTRRRSGSFKKGGNSDTETGSLESKTRKSKNDNKSDSDQGNSPESKGKKLKLEAKSETEVVELKCKKNKNESENIEVENTKMKSSDAETCSPEGRSKKLKGEEKHVSDVENVESKHKKNEKLSELSITNAEPKQKKTKLENTPKIQKNKSENIDTETEPCDTLQSNNAEEKITETAPTEVLAEEVAPQNRRSLRNKFSQPSESILKRSSRRRSKDCSESVLQSAIARKEKSYNETQKPQRLSRRLKPTAKILANLEMCRNQSALRSKIINKDTPRSLLKSPPQEKIKSSTDTDSAQNNISLENGLTENVSSIVDGEADVKDLQQTVDSSKRPKNKIKKNIKKVKSKKTSLKLNTETESEQNWNSQENGHESDSANRLTNSSTDCNNRRTYRSKKKETEWEAELQALEAMGRRRSQRRPLSPNIAEQGAEQSAAQPEPTSAPTHYNMCVQTKCLCKNRTQFFVSSETVDGIMYCTAADSIDGKTFGCSNPATSKEICLRRPSTRVPYIILCDVHLQRLVRHNCCPSCGLFCTQGRFAQCLSGHQYHRECQAVEFNDSLSRTCCPHCGDETSQKDVFIALNCETNPAFIPVQKLYYPSARMSFPIKSQKDNSVSTENSESPIILSTEILAIQTIDELNSKCQGNSEDSFSIEDLYDAAESGDCEKLVKIIGSGVNVTHPLDSRDGATALHVACASGNLSATHLLLSAGAAVDALDADQRSPLMLAVLEKHDQIVSYLLKIGASVTLKGTDGMTALHLAAKIGNMAACKLLLSKHSTTKTCIDTTDDGGWTALVWACEHAHAPVVRYLLQCGADARSRDVEHNVPLHWAAFGGNMEVTELILNAGCNVNAINVHGDSPLHVAARQDQYNCVLILLARGANPNQQNNAGESPLDCCGSDDPPGACYQAISLNVEMQALVVNSQQKKYVILSNDISRGKESNPVQCVNWVDDEPKPTDFVYISENCITSDIAIDRKITTLQSCRCEDRCGAHDCLCCSISLKCWYDEEGKLSPDFNFLDPPMLFECNQACACNTITCNNRVVQHGLTQRFQLFRTQNKGWGIRTLRFIPRGAYVCEYVGEIITDLEADHREDDSYLFDLDNREGETYCIDARKYGNLARFINHSCQPNLLPVRVFIDHHDLHFPRIAFFANRDIDADEELGFDYGEKFWIIKYKSFTCTCGSVQCKYSETTIQTTLENYKLKMQEENALLQQQT